MISTRIATSEDAKVIALQRQKMFSDNGQAERSAMINIVGDFTKWVRPRLQDGTYLGWLMEDQGKTIAGAGLWLMDFPPHFLHATPIRAYLLNFYVEPSHRGQGLANQLLKLALAESTRRKIEVVTLHASSFGRSIYKRNGFLDTNEMMLTQ